MKANFWMESISPCRFRIIIALSIIWFVVLLPPSIEAGQYGDFTYTVENGEAAIIRYTGGGGNVVVPETIEGMSVTSLGDMAFSGCWSPMNVTLPQQLKSLGKLEFYGCSGLTNITIPDSVTNIGSGSFYACVNLTALNLPDGITQIYSGLCSGCSRLANVAIGSGVTNIEVPVFSSCTGLTNFSVNPGNHHFSVRDGVLFNQDQTILIQYPPGRQGSYDVPATVTNIGAYAFSGCAGLTKISVPKGVTVLGAEAFNSDALKGIFFEGNAPALPGERVFNSSTTVYYPADATGWYASYEGHPSMLWNKLAGYTYRMLTPTTIEITQYLGTNAITAAPSIIDGRAVTRYGDRAFAGVLGLGDFAVPDGVTSFGNEVFAGCAGLTNIVLPGSLTNLGNSTFYGCVGITNITVPGGIAEIGDHVFFNCAGLQSVSLPESLVSVDDLAFSVCVNLTDIALPASVTNLGNSSFSYCGSLTSFNVPDGVAHLGNMVFSECFGLTNIVLPESLADIGDSAFSGCKKLPQLLLPPHLTTVGTYAFYDCQALTNLALPNSVGQVGGGAFARCGHLASVSFGTGLTNIGVGMFVSCPDLENIFVDPNNLTFSDRDGVFFNKDQTRLLAYPMSRAGTYRIPNTVNSIETYAFIGCSGLSDVVIPPGVTNIGNYAFCSCNTLTNLTLPASLATLGDYAFTYCSDLTCLLFEGSAPVLGGDWVFVSTGLTNIYYLAGTTGWRSTFGGLAAAPWKEAIDFNYTAVNQSVIEITGYTGNKSAVNVPSTIDGLPVTRIGAYAFENCAGITNITLPDSLNYIGEAAFYRCTSLTSLIVPDNVTIIGGNVFNGCASLQSVTLGKSLVSFGYNDVFTGCASLTNITVNPANPFFCDRDGVLFDYNQNFLIQYPPGRAGAYSVPGSVGEIENEAFSGCAGLTSIEVPANVTSIGIAVFSGCSSLTNIILPNSLTHIGSSMFLGCSGLRDIVWPSSVPTIDYRTFYGCSALTNIVLPNNLTNIGGAAFYGCSNLASLVLPDGVLDIPDHAFEGCSSLTNLVLPPNLCSIGFYSFAGCSSLKNLNLPDKVTSVWVSAFVNCSGLETVNIGRSLQDFGNYAFLGCTNLKSVTFSGNAPVLLGDDVFYDATNATVYSFQGTTGWGAEFGGLPVIQWSNKDDFTYTALSPITIEITGYTGNATALIIPDIIGGKFVTQIGIGMQPIFSKLTSLRLPSHLVNMSPMAFAYCTALKNLSLPDSMTNIESMVFLEAASLTNIVIGKGIASIGWHAFEGCRGLTRIQVDSNNPAFSDIDGILFNKAQTELVRYPAGKSGDYSVPVGVTNIAEAAFTDCSGITRLSLPDSVLSIGICAFSGSRNLVSATIGNHLNTISGGAFNYCSKLLGVYFKGNAPAIPEEPVFQGSPAAIVYYPAGTVGWTAKFGYRPYDVQTAVWEPEDTFNYREISDTAVEITQCVIYGGAATVPDVIDGKTVTSIGSGAFAGITNLATLTISQNVTNIGDAAFAGCTGLVGVYFKGNAPALVGANVFEAATNAIVYYVPGATGWSSIYGGRPTVQLPPTYEEWVNLIGLADAYPNASGEQDDPDHDGMSNYDEYLAGTEPADPHSTLVFEAAPRPADLSEPAQTPIGANQFALYFQSVPGKSYDLLSSDRLGGIWSIAASNIVATTSQTRIVIDRPSSNAIYRMSLHP